LGVGLVEGMGQRRKKMYKETVVESATQSDAVEEQ
jgi:hypothetical protein